MWCERYLTIGDKKITYKIREAGELSSFTKLLFIHGQAWTGEVWTCVAKKLHGVHIIAPDMAGHGESDESEATDFNSLSNDLQNLLDQIHAEKVWVIAHSWGANLALNFADKYPEHVKGLMLVDAGYFNYQEWPGINWEAFIDFDIPEPMMESVDSYVRFQSEDTPYWNEDVEKAVRDQVREIECGKVTLKCNLKTMLACSKALWDFNPYNHLSHLQFPVYLILAKPNRESNEISEFKNKSLTYFRKLADKCHIVTLENTSHMVMLERPETTATIIEEMIGNQ